MTESKELKLTFHLFIGAMSNEAYHKDQLKDLFFLTFIYVTYSSTEIDITNHADDTTPYVLDSKLENIVKLLEKNAGKLFDWFSNYYLIENPDKCHLIVNTTDNIRISIRNETISNSSNQKLLRIHFNSNFRFNDQVASLCKKAS